MNYKWIVFTVLFVGIFATNHLAITDRRPLAASIAFTLMVLAVYWLEKMYGKKVEPVKDERTELISMKAFYYGSMGFLVALMYELIWLVSADYDSALQFVRLLLPPIGVLLLVLLSSKAYLERVM
ncbi:DUF2178 domain-containing protein [Thermococcus zilligii]|uniref:DUF2178 domain-containing protein n=1 Tax=Thermococcus zilligii TaxID=54076 RepID=UPI00029A1911|nr:DUF2178 domain-containing protein [Thermococcus zilligii]